VVAWNYPLNTRNDHHPILTFVVLSWYPFRYAVTLRAFVGGETADVTRFDNRTKGAGHHCDIFFRNGKKIKHIPSPLGKIESLGDFRKIGMFLEKNGDELIAAHMANVPPVCLKKSIKSMKKVKKRAERRKIRWKKRVPERRKKRRES
jgi:hypothetical protein